MKIAAVPIRHLFPIALAVIAFYAPPAPVAMAQSAPGPATKQPAAPDPAITRPMVFYDAHGEANACGPGCSEWIAAEGKIDKDTADRLEHLLARLKGARPPIFLHSPGGSVTGSIALGELIRARKLTVTVGHTVPLNCDREPKHQNSCDAEMRGGHPIKAEIDPLTAMCNSACVYALAGGVIRLIPPWVTLGIHDIGIDLSKAKIRHPSTVAINAAKAASRARLRNYVRRMGIDEGLLTEAFATPFASVSQLARDDAARFGLDRREFGETVWRFAAKPQPTIRKLFFIRADSGEHRYANAVVSLSCVPWLGRANAVLARQRLASETETVVGQPTVNIRMNGQDIRLARATSAKFYLWRGELAVKTLEAGSDEATMVLPAEEFGRQQGPSGDISLGMAGFSAAYATWQKACAEQIAQAQGAQAATPWLQGLTGMPNAYAIPPLRSSAPAIGASRSEVEAKFGAPAETVCRWKRESCDAIALYRDSSSDDEHKVNAAYFDSSDHLQRFARYVLKDQKVFDEISQTELSEGLEFASVRHLLADQNIGQHAAPPGSSQELSGAPIMSGDDPPSSGAVIPPSSPRQE